MQGPVGLVGGLPPALGNAVELALRRRYVLAVLLLLLVGLAVTMAVLGRSQAQEVELQPAVTSQAPVPESLPETASPEPALLRVHVLGAVARPGVVQVPEGSIVVDALEAAGGLLPEADPGGLNLAARLADGQQVVVGTTVDPGGEVNGGETPDGSTGSGAGSGAGAPVNLNTASQAQLEELPGVGPVLAGEIIAWRDANGGFTAVSELQEVSGIGPKTFQRLEPLVTV